MDRNYGEFGRTKKYIKKSDLQNGDIVTYRSGNKRIVNKNEDKIVFLEDFENLSFYFDDFDEDLMSLKHRQYDIINVYRPTTYEKFFTKHEVKEMTIAEISKILGYEVKIIKGGKIK